MIVHHLTNLPSPQLAQALDRFEKQFRYPLGPDRTFRISHGEDYPRFFRAMGEATCFVAARDGSILGVIGAAIRSLVLPGGEERRVLYLGDLKIDPAARGGRTLLRLSGAVQQWAGTRVAAAFAVVMDGTPAIPSRYTGRFGMPRFSELGKVVVLRLPTSEIPGNDGEWLTTEERGNACFLRLSAGQFTCPGGNPAERSEMKPVWLMDPGGRACGRLEDTRRAKRLIADDDIEMQSAHLSCFAYQDRSAGIALVRVAMRQAAERGMPALFVAISTTEVKNFCQPLEGTGVVLAPATIYGAGLQPGSIWNINTAEI
jgi:hypothetical protein